MPGDHVGIYGVNSVEWIESLWAVFKLRAVWININYRYVEDELAYLFGNADLKALIHDAAFADRVAGVAPRMPDLRHRLVIGLDFEEALATGSPERDFGPARATTGTSSTPAAPPACPRGSSGATRTCCSPSAAESTSSPASGPRRPRTWWPGAAGWASPWTFLPIAPLMHGATQWAVMGQSFQGHRVVLMGRSTRTRCGAWSRPRRPTRS